jgi:hypothetical protein
MLSPGYHCGNYIILRSFAFLHYWVFEAPGNWTVRSAIVAAALTIAIFAVVLSTAP